MDANTKLYIWRNKGVTRSTTADKTKIDVVGFLANSLAMPFHHIPHGVLDVIVKIFNFFLLLCTPRQLARRRYANLHREAKELASNLMKTQFFAIYYRFSTKHKYHPLQRFQFMPRKFDLSADLAKRMENENGTQAFYEAVCPKEVPPITVNFSPDFTTIDELSSVHKSAEYLYENLSKNRGKEIAGLAKDLYVRGYSRRIRVSDPADWDKFRAELTDDIHVAAESNLVYPEEESNVSLIALSYKSHELIRDRAFSTEGENGDPVRFTLQEKTIMTDIYFEDFRWSQVIRTATEIAREENSDYVRIWIDRFVMMGRDEPFKNFIRKEKVQWEDYGLWAYAVCPVVRLYQEREDHYLTEFWRKLELVMAVAGKGIFLDDYMLERFDNSIYYGKSLYTRYYNGICKIGGKGKYIRSVTLAIATAVLTDGVSVAGLNEHKNTRRGIIGWKAWALRTLAEGAYSSDHAVLLQVEEAFTVGLSQFCIIAFWESISTQNRHLEGDSYLDMSLQQSTEYRKNERWHGICEWIGMVRGACEIKQNEEITRYLNEFADVRLYTNITQQVAGLLTLRSKDNKYRRGLAVNLSRFSRVQGGQVIAVAEATGLNNGKSWLPWYLVHVRDPETDQTAGVDRNGVLWFKHKPIRVFYRWTMAFFWIMLAIYDVMWLVLAAANRLMTGIFIGIWLLHTLFLLILVARCLSWPWKDIDMIGEGLFDNVLMHGIYRAGIKKRYKKFEVEPYNSIGWGERFLKSGTEYTSNEGEFHKGEDSPV